ncbi:hypothetical protein N9L92_02670 [Saprospiraceae bacterium]|nr:hypothetical protein [Saprospiraceae bacterium]
MDSKSFDNIIKAKLENMSSDATPRWDLFKEKKSAHDAIRADKSFDNNIRRSISEYTVPYNASHWTVLKERLENIYRIRKAIYSIKVYELLAILLLFYGIGTNYDYIFSIKHAATPVALNTIDNNTPADNNTTAQQIVSDNALALEALSLEETASNQSINNTITSKKLLTDNALSQATYPVNNSNNRALTYNAQQNNISNGVSNQKTVNTITSTESSNILNSISGKNSNVFIESITGVDHNFASITWDRKEVLFDSDFGIKPLHSGGSDGKWLHVAASFDNNQISTPFNEVFNPNGPESKEMYGYTLSGLFSIQKNNFEYETGLGYSLYNKPVSLRSVWDNNIGDVFVYSLTNISYDILSIPLRVKYHFIRNQDWSLFVTGGVSSEFIVSAGYDENNEKLNINAPTPQGGTNPTNPELTESPFRTDANFHNGLFEGGSFKENFMLRAQIGAGMERNITPTLSAYISGDFYTSILKTTYGPTDDSINKFALTFGIKERF